MRSDRVVVAAPRLDHDPGFGESVEDLTVEKFIPEFAVERFDVSVFPWTAGFDVGGLGADGGDPRAERRSDELRPIVRSNMSRDAPQDEEIAQRHDDVGRVEASCDPDCQGFSGKLIDNAQHAICLSIMGPVGDKVVGPDVIGPLRPQTDARSVIQPEAASFGLSARDLKPLTPPQPFNSLLVD